MLIAMSLAYLVLRDAVHGNTADVALGLKHGQQLRQHTLGKDASAGAGGGQSVCFEVYYACMA